MKRILVAVLVVALAAGVIATALVVSRKSSPDLVAGPQVELTAVRTEDWAGPDGRTAKMVYADWRNTGDRPVRRVTAKVVVLDAAGEVVFVAGRVDIYAAPADSAGVGSGEGYVEPDGAGVSLPGVTDATLSAVEVTSVSE